MSSRIASRVLSSARAAPRMSRVAPAARNIGPSVNFSSSARRPTTAAHSSSPSVPGRQRRPTAAPSTPLPPRHAYSQSRGAPTKIWSFDDVRKLADDGSSKVVIIDAREPLELEATGRIPGAINIPITSSPDSFHITETDFEDRFGFARPAKDAELLFYCKAGVRSRAAAGLAKEAGWNNVGEFPGSWLEWSEKGGNVQK